MVLNFCVGGAAINVFARQHHIALTVVDAGVVHDFSPTLPIVRAKIALGTKNFLVEPAMTKHECEQAISQGAALVRKKKELGCNIIGFGEMGIGNTSSAAALMHIITRKPLEYCVGAGSGLDDTAVLHKRRVIAEAVLKHHAVEFSPLEALQTFGGFEIAMICGAMLEAASQRMTILVDGFIATSALLTAHALYPNVLHYCIFSHESQENGHAAMHRFLGVEPLLRLGMRLGEGTGAAMAYPIIQAAVNFLNAMATFDSAQVSGKIVEVNAL
jgi:nicotinate-nucleotide--dimethylbenzimidazole phosphoribosyltransferase